MAKKVIYFDKLFGFSVTAVTESGKLTDCRFTEDSGTPAIGDIYKGVVVNVLGGMQAAFVDCGLERNCYLSAEDLPMGTEGGVGSLKAGDELMVQVIKTPEGKKGAKVTTRISFVGKTLIYLPTTDFVGVSHRIEDDELRNSLIFAAKRAKKAGEGLVIRNYAPLTNYKHIREELNFLRKVYKKAEKTYRGAPPRSLICTDFTMPVRVMREFMEYDVERIITASREQFSEVEELLKILPEGQSVALEFYEGKRDMLDERGVAAQIKEACSRRVDLKGGAYLIIERTESLTSIDVNTGGFIGDDSLEYTVFQTNLCAAREIARQVKLRNAGGLFVVDFIDMQSPEHRKALTDELDRALKRDGAPYRVLPMSEFGLVEFTRKRSGAELSAFALKPCPVCGAGSGYSDAFCMFVAYSEILTCLSGGVNSVCAEVPPDIIKTLAERADFAAAIREKFPEAEVLLIPSQKVRGEGCICYANDGRTAGRHAVKIL